MSGVQFPGYSVQGAVSSMLGMCKNKYHLGSFGQLCPQAGAALCHDPVSPGPPGLKVRSGPSVNLRDLRQQSAECVVFMRSRQGRASADFREGLFPLPE